MEREGETGGLGGCGEQVGHVVTGQGQRQQLVLEQQRVVRIHQLSLQRLPHGGEIGLHVEQDEGRLLVFRPLGGAQLRGSVLVPVADDSRRRHLVLVGDELAHGHNVQPVGGGQQQGVADGAILDGLQLRPDQLRSKGRQGGQNGFSCNSHIQKYPLIMSFR